MDVVVVLGSGKFASNVAELLMVALGKVESWCDQVGRRVYPRNTFVVPFTWRRKLGPVLMEGVQLEPAARLSIF